MVTSRNKNGIKIQEHQEEEEEEAAALQDVKFFPFFPLNKFLQRNCKFPVQSYWNLSPGMDEAADGNVPTSLNSLKIGIHQSACETLVSPSKIRRKSADVRLVARHSEVYEPCDDSFALVDALLADRVNIEDAKPKVCVELGCGSGYVITSLALMLGKESGIHFFATDISPAAAEVTRKTLTSHGVYADVIQTDLVSGLDKRLVGTVDILVVNPPYVPTSEDEVGSDGIVASWAGGEHGRTVINRILTVVDDLLSSKGWFYLVTLTANNPGEICLIMKQKGFASRIVVQRSTEEESLHVLKFWRDLSEIPSDYGTSPTHQTLTRKLSRLAFWKNS